MKTQKTERAAAAGLERAVEALALKTAEHAMRILASGGSLRESRLIWFLDRQAEKGGEAIMKYKYPWLSGYFIVNGVVVLTPAAMVAAKAK